MVAVKDARGGLAHLLVRICAVVGGVFAVTGMLIAFSSFSAVFHSLSISRVLQLCNSILHNVALITLCCLCANRYLRQMDALAHHSSKKSRRQAFLCCQLST